MFASMGGMKTADLAIVKLWVDGKHVPLDAGRLLVGPAGSDWSLQATVSGQGLSERSHGLSMQLSDRRVVHGRARLASVADGHWLFEGLDPLGGAWA